MIQLHIEAPTTEDLHKKLKGILYGLAVEPARQLEAAKTTVTPTQNVMDALRHLPVQTPEQQIALKAAVEQPPKKRGRPARAEAAPQPEPEKPAEKVVGEPADHFITEEIKPAEVPSIDDLRRSLMRLANAEGRGSEAVFELLGKYNAKNASTVPEDKRAEVIAAVNEKLGG